MHFLQAARAWHRSRRFPRGAAGLMILLMPAVLCARTITLASRSLAVELDSATGAVKKVENRLTGDAKAVRSEPFHLTTTRGELTARECQLSSSSHDRSLATFRFSGKELEVELQYGMESAGSGALRKFLRITNRGRDDVTLFRIGMFKWTLPAGPWPPGYPHSYCPNAVNDIHFHKSGIWYDHSINLFVRDETGGLFVGVENPYFEANHRALRKVYPSWFEISYRPRWVLAPGETFESDPGFLGAYRHQKIYAISPARVYFSGRERAPLEVLDWGEVWAMQNYMRSIMPPPSSSKGRYYMAYWGLADPGRLGQISRRKARGEPLTKEEQAMLAHFGGGPFSFRDQELWYQLTPETERFYRKVIDDAAWLGHFQTLVIPNMMAGHSGWFESPEQKKDRATVQSLVDTWFKRPAFPAWKRIADYAAKKSMRMSTLELARREYRKGRPEWKTQKADGERGRSNCYGNPAYAEWYTDQVSQALANHPLGHFQWDEGWMDGLIGKDAHCYASDHRHLPGNISYQQFRNVQWTLRTLKESHPGAHLVIISGLIRGMPWIMKHLDADSHTGAIERAALVDNNQYFLPPSRSHRRGGIHWVLENFSAGVEYEPGDPDSGPKATTGWYTMLEDPAARRAYREYWDRWVSWASQNLEYLQVRRDLFVSPDGSSGLEGTAHMRGRRGFLFLHNAAGVGRGGQVPLNSWLGLEEGPRFQVRQIYPVARDFGVYAWGDNLTFALQAEQTLLFKIEATSGPVRRRLPKLPDGLVVQKAFLTLPDILRLIEADDLWPAAPLPGKGNMPTF